MHFLVSPWYQNAFDFHMCYLSQRPPSRVKIAVLVQCGLRIGVRMDIYCARTVIYCARTDKYEYEYE